jgi:hypothetical protein
MQHSDNFGSLVARTADFFTLVVGEAELSCHGPARVG